MKLQLSFIGSNDGGHSRFEQAPLIDYSYRYETDASAELLDELAFLLSALEWIEDVVILKRRRLVVVLHVETDALEHKTAASVAKFIVNVAAGLT